MELHQVALQMYCRGLTGSVWEAEDLAQDTWFKVFKHLSQAPDERTLSKTYLYRIARNTWIDHCRKNRLALDTLADDLELAADPPMDSFELEAVLETLIAELPPRQRIILLLMDVLRYTATETARLLDSTEEAVKAGLHRARRRLGRLQSRLAADSKPTAANTKSVQVDEQIVKAYLEAFQHKNPYALASLLNDQAGIDLLPVITGSKHKRPQTPQQANWRGSNDCYSLRCRADGEGRTFLRHLLPAA
jgi:RNA polymerase sigma-70 factor (ECF subfamily)